MLRQTEFVSLFNDNLRKIQSSGELQALPLLSEDMLSRLLPNQQSYNPKDIPDVMDLLKKEAKEAKSIALTGTSARWKNWAKSNSERIRQQEDVLWSRKRYVQQLNNMADEWHIPPTGFLSWDDENTYRNWLNENRLREGFEDKLKEIVTKHQSARLPLGNEWIWCVERHLFSREQGRLAARLRVEIEIQPKIKVEYDRFGKMVDAHLEEKYDMPLDIIKECKKDLKKIIADMGLGNKRRGKVAHKRDRAIELYEKTNKEISLQSDKKLRQDYKKLVEG